MDSCCTHASLKPSRSWQHDATTGTKDLESWKTLCLSPSVWCLTIADSLMIIQITLKPKRHKATPSTMKSVARKAYNKPIKIGWKQNENMFWKNEEKKQRKRRTKREIEKEKTAENKKNRSLIENENKRRKKMEKQQKHWDKMQEKHTQKSFC